MNQMERSDIQILRDCQTCLSQANFQTFKPACRRQTFKLPCYLRPKILKLKGIQVLVLKIKEIHDVNSKFSFIFAW